ncbi:MAG: hypothetical protein OXG05_05690 [Gammaproteobacteria bacterium]|nr:hypothetical protein [Gammaproteobacteria bacterium]
MPVSVPDGISTAKFVAATIKAHSDIHDIEVLTSKPIRQVDISTV